MLELLNPHNALNMFLFQENIGSGSHFYSQAEIGYSFSEVNIPVWALKITSMCHFAGSVNRITCTVPTPLTQIDTFPAVTVLGKTNDLLVVGISSTLERTWQNLITVRSEIYL